MPKNSSVITIYFGLSKGEGTWPKVRELSRAESEDPRQICKFYLDFDEGTNSTIKVSDIKSCTIIYDGVSPLPQKDGHSLGLFLDNNHVQGRLRPIIQFKLDKAVNVEEFRKLVWGSNYHVRPKKSQEVFYAEDWNGYTEVLSEKRTQEWIRLLKSHNVFSGKVFKPARLIAGICAAKLMEPQPEIREMNTPVFKNKLQKARRLVKKHPHKFIKSGKTQAATLVFSEISRRGTWQITISRDPLLCPQPFLVAFFVPKDKSQPSGYSISVYEISAGVAQR